MTVRLPDGDIQPLEVDCLIVGAGFSGCYLLHLLRQLNLNVRIFESAKGLGGVWQWSRYPGAAVDCEMPYYGYSDSAIWGSWVWTERFPGHAELRRYFAHVDKIWDLSKDVDFETRVVEARFLQDERRWVVRTANGRTCKCKWFLCATGIAFKQYIPDSIETTMHRFQGPIYHASMWPEDGVALEGKRVAVIGAGPTALQLVQEAGKVASQLTEFIRTPSFAVPMRQREISAEEIESQKNIIPFVFDLCKTTLAGFPMAVKDTKTFDELPGARQAHWEAQWKRGGFSFFLNSYADFMIDAEANRAAYDFWAEKTRARISDPVKRDLLAPLDPPYAMSTKRPGVEQDYYEQVDQPHVEITKSPIVEVTQNGIRTEDKEYDFDIIAIATGYDAVTGGLTTMGIKDKDGIDLQEKWRDGIRTTLGMTVHGCPNFYFTYGPQAPTSWTNAVVLIERQCEWIRDLIVKQRSEDIALVESKLASDEIWRQTCAYIVNMTLLPQTDSWWNGGNIPGKNREFLSFVGGVPMYNKVCQDALEGWKSFDLTPA